MRVLVVLLLLVLGAAGCCQGGGEVETVFTPASTASASECQWTSISWTEPNQIASGTNVLVVNPSEDKRIELYSEAGDRIDLVEERAEQATCESGCPSPR